ncbi:20399_t:CDS:2 [Cetraspora pellucida]|uniref:20399_t:CDS:1 n=1 Tax=Cetraspora pellucida TaxID=1433469 RepID=A0A9N9IQE9_9GLOM|nr:20399_t:CDS:2 [Cetraspora pellucida]
MTKRSPRLVQVTKTTWKQQLKMNQRMNKGTPLCKEIQLLVPLFQESVALYQQYQDFKKRIESYNKEKSANIRPEQEPYAGSSANKEENPYLQDDASIIDGVGLQKNDLIQDEQKGPLLPSIEIDNDKRNSTSSKDKDLSSDPISAPCNELAALYLNAEL